MAQHGVSSGTFEIESPADKYFGYIVDHYCPTSDPKPEERINYWSEYVNCQEKTLTIEMRGFSSGSYKTVTTTITVTPKEDEAEGSRVMWTFEFEKMRLDISDPHFIIDSIVNFLQEIDGKLKL